MVNSIRNCIEAVLEPWKHERMGPIVEKQWWHGLIPLSLMFLSGVGLASGDMFLFVFELISALFAQFFLVMASAYNADTMYYRGAIDARLEYQQFLNKASQEWKSSRKP